MATVINNPGQGDGDNSGGGAGLIIGVIVAIVIIVLFVVYGIPALKSGSDSGTQVNVPDQIDVNIDDGSGSNN